MSGAVILLSGGLDSAVNLAAAAEAGRVDLALTFDYGQLAAAREVEAAAAMAARYNVAHRVIDAPWLVTATSALTGQNVALPEPLAEELDDRVAAGISAAAVWVPNRNGVFLNIAAALAEQIGASDVVAGFNAEEAATFPDNSADFVEAVNEALAFSTRGAVRTLSYTIDLDKAGIVRWGKELSAPLDLVWACYRGGERMCGRCESCRRLRRAFVAAGDENLEGRFSD
jgi:7-cyano-7-deazaguanine synthase